MKNDGKKACLRGCGKIRALFFVNSLAGGGAERVCLNLAEQLYKLKIESDFIIIFNKKVDYNIPNYVHIFSLQLDDPYLTRFSLIRQIPKVNAYISDKEYVLITAHLYPAYQLASLTKVGKKCLYVIHLSHWLDNRKYLRNILRKKHIVTVSKGLENEFCNRYKINPAIITTIYNPCDISKLQSGRGLKNLHTRPYILVMGRLEEQKNPLLALELYYRGGFYISYDLVFLGRGSLEDKLRSKIEDYNMQAHAFLMGFQKNAVQWLLQASLLLSCSKQEGLPMNLIEALICGTPVVASDCPYGPNEILVDELAKYLIHPERDMDKSIAVISSALESYPKITEKYYSKFDAEIIVQRYISIWQEYFEME